MVETVETVVVVEVDAGRVVVVVVVMVAVCVTVVVMVLDVVCVAVDVALEAVVAPVTPEATFVPVNAGTGMPPHIAVDSEEVIPDAGTHTEPSQYCIVRLDGG